MSLAPRSPVFSVDEFSQLVSATFDGIGHPDLDLVPARASDNADPDVQVVPPTVDEPPRPPTVSLLRKVKSRVHDVVTRHPHLPTHDALPTAFSEKHPVVSIASSSPISPRSRARAKSLPRAFLHIHPPSPPDSDALPPVPPIPHSFFEHDSDSDISAHATLPIQPRSATPSRGSGAFRRLSSLFDSPPRILHSDVNSEWVRSPTPLHKSTSVPLLNLAGNAVDNQEEDHADAEQPSKPSFKAKLRTLRLSRSKLNLFNPSSTPAPLSAPPTVLTSEPTPVPPHPYARAYARAYDPPSPAQSTPSLSFSPAATPVTPFSHNSTHNHHQSTAGSHLAPPFDSQSPNLSDRPITPEDDPFRKAAPTAVQPAQPMCRKIHKSRSTPAIENRPSTGSSASSKSLSGSPPRGGVDAVSRGSRAVSKPSQLRPLHIPSLTSVPPLKYQSATCASPLSFTFPLPPSDQDIGGVTVTVSTPPPQFPPPAFPPPTAPPPNVPLPKVPSQEHRRRRSKLNPLPPVPGPAKALREQLRAGIGGMDGRKDLSHRTKSRRRGVLVGSSSPDETIRSRAEGRVRAGSPFPLSLDLNAAAGRVDEEVGRRSELAIEEALDEMLLERRSANLTMDGFEAQDAGVQFTNPWAPSDAAWDDDVRPDSEVEPEWVIEALSQTTDARKASVASTASTSTVRSDTSTATASSMTSVSGESNASNATRDTVIPLPHPEPRQLETVETVRKQRAAFAMRLHAAEEDHEDADDESGSVEDSVWSSPGSLPGTLADWTQAQRERQPRMPCSYPSPEGNSSPSFTWSALGLESMVPQPTYTPSSSSNRLSDLWLNIPAPTFPTPQSHSTSALGLQGVPPLPVSSTDESELEVAGKSGWFE